MIRQIIVGFASEGKTDMRFLENIIQRSFEKVAFECIGQIEILPVQPIQKKNGSFVEIVKAYAQEADNRGIMVLCIHTDADSETDDDAFVHKIIPAFEAAWQSGDVICKNLVAIVPVQMTEAWMLSDTEVLKAEIGTEKSDNELGLYKFPEIYGDPKQAIADAIMLARQEYARHRRRELSISDLYLPVGQKIDLNKLENLPSFVKFIDAVRGAFRELGYLA